MFRKRLAPWCAALALAAGAPPVTAAAPAAPAVKAFQPQVTGLSIVVIRTKVAAEWKRYAVLQEPWFYCSKVSGVSRPRTDGYGELYAVPAGYITDFASVPGWSKSWTPPFGAWAEAAVIHDWLHDLGVPGKRREVDAIFREALVDMQVSGFRRTLMHWAVRVGGGGAYKRAGERDPDVWRSHFVDRQGEPLPAPPFPQPTEKMVWDANFPCAKLEIPSEVEALQRAYEDKYPLGGALQ